jgi:hypothetical protein
MTCMSIFFGGHEPLYAAPKDLVQRLRHELSATTRRNSFRSFTPFAILFLTTRRYYTFGSPIMGVIARRSPAFRPGLDRRCEHSECVATTISLIFVFVMRRFWRRAWSESHTALSGWKTVTRETAPWLGTYVRVILFLRMFSPSQAKVLTILRSLYLMRTGRTVIFWS